MYVETDERKQSGLRRGRRGRRGRNNFALAKLILRIFRCSTKLTLFVYRKDPRITVCTVYTAPTCTLVFIHQRRYSPIVRELRSMTSECWILLQSGF
jgi:hypothetical protein